MLENNLEIVLVTFNRFKDLENTLKQLFDSPFSKCKITILDNHSTDKTPEVCENYHKLFSNINIIRHKKNIGSGANYLRAVELTSLEYTWILCDDDLYDFTDCKDVINAINSRKFDLILLGAPCQNNWERGLTTSSKNLIKRGSKFHYILSFIPSTIYRTELYDSECIIKGYLNINNLFPQFEFINKSIENNSSVYISKKEIITRGIHNPTTFSGIQYIESWINSCSTINNKKLRRKVAYEEPVNTDNLDSFQGFIKRIVFSIIIGKIVECKGSKDFNLLISSLLSSRLPAIEIFLMVTISFIMIILPSFIHKFILKVYMKIYSKDEGEISLEQSKIDYKRCEI